MTSLQTHVCHTFIHLLTHLLLSCRVPLLVLFTHHALVEPGPQHTKGDVSVFQLRASLLTFGGDACWEGDRGFMQNWILMFLKTYAPEVGREHVCFVLPVGRWTMRTALSVVLTLWPPAPRARYVSMRRSFGSMWTSNYAQKAHKKTDILLCDANKPRLVRKQVVKRKW